MQPEEIGRVLSGEVLDARAADEVSMSYRRSTARKVRLFRVLVFQASPFAASAVSVAEGDLSNLRGAAHLPAPPLEDFK